jgi:hypothetical protein
MKAKGPIEGQRTLNCDGCGRECDACSLILFGYDEFHKLYCSPECVPPLPKPKNAWQWIRMQLGLHFVTTEGTLCRYG